MNEAFFYLELQLKNIRCFKDIVTLDLSDGNGKWKKWNLILGDNGVGKTTILQALACVSAKKPFDENLGFTRNLAYGMMSVFTSTFDFLVGEKKSYKESEIRCKLTQNSTITLHKTINSNNLKEYSGDISQDKSDLLVIGYGANRNSGESGFLHSRNSFFLTLFDDSASLINADYWLLQLDYSIKVQNNRNTLISLQEKLSIVKSLLTEILPDVKDMRFVYPSTQSIESKVEFETSFGWFDINSLGFGYKSMIVLMTDLASKMFESYPNSPNPLEEPGVVLIDEIDLHLHPKWQRKIFDYLSDKFPNTQFIVTAHSPLIVQSVPNDANIVVLRQEGDHVLIDNDVKSVQNWRLDQIMSSDLFGIESSRGPEAEKLLSERKQLLAKNKLSEEDTKRLDELNRFADDLPTGDNEDENEAMRIIKEAADFFKTKGMK